MLGRKEANEKNFSRSYALEFVVAQFIVRQIPAMSC